jgi:hypothetical protein
MVGIVDPEDYDETGAKVRFGPVSPAGPGLRRGLLVMLAVALAGPPLTMWVFGGDDGAPTERAPLPDLGPAHVSYHVYGTAKGASITYSTGSGDSAQQECVGVPLKRTSDGGDGLVVTMDHGGFAYLSAQNCGQEGSVTCEIRVDHEVVDRNTSYGAHTIATCSTRV